MGLRAPGRRGSAGPHARAALRTVDCGIVSEERERVRRQLPLLVVAQLRRHGERGRAQLPSGQWEAAAAAAEGAGAAPTTDVDTVAMATEGDTEGEEVQVTAVDIGEETALAEAVLVEAVADE